MKTKTIIVQEFKKNTDKSQFHKAAWIIIDPFTIIENACIEVKNGFIIDVHKKTRNSNLKNCIDYGDGVLMPPLINVHLHLELSAIKNLPMNKGFLTWVKKLLKKRAALSKAQLINAAKKEITSLVSMGNLYIGEISSFDITKPSLETSDLKGVFFHEFLGSKIPSCKIDKNNSLCTSLAGHAPHTTSEQLLLSLKKKSLEKRLPFSIHVAESWDETKFIRDKKGKWADFLNSRNIDFSSWNIGSKTPVEYLSQIGLLDSFTIAVHVLNVDDNDLEILAKSKTKICLCPRSSYNLHDKKLPDIYRMLAKGIKPAIGTDSLASCDSLNIFDEMAFVEKHYPKLSLETIFSMATINAAKALCIEHLTGNLVKGKQARFIYRDIKAKNKKQVLKKAIFG